MRIIVCADDPLARAGLAAMLGSLPEILVVAEEAVALLAGDDPWPLDEQAEVVVWDVGWGGVADGVDVGTIAMPVVALVGDDEQAGDAWLAGAQALLWRNTPVDDILIALQAVDTGFVVLATGFTGTLNRQTQVIVDPDSEDLTARETEVLELVAQGLTNKAIGRQLSISEHTVKFHLNAILSKLHAQSRTDAVVKATRQGLISL